MQEIIKYIEENNLTKVSRKREVIYPRYYLYNKLREQAYTLHHIAKIFNKDHCTILHGIKIHKLFTKQKDRIYYQLTEKERDLFGDKHLIRPLHIEVLDCEDLKTLKLIKKRIRLNLYEYI